VHADRLGAHHDSCRLETILAVAIILGAVLPAAAASTAAASTAQAARLAGHAPAVPVFMGTLGGVSATSTTDAWAVGDQCPTCGNPGTLTLHWNGTRWSMVPSPSPGPTGNSLNGVTAVSPTDVWVTGDYCAPKCGGHIRTLIMHWNGTAWTTVSSPDPGNISFLPGVAATASGNAWRVGGTCLTSVCGVNINALVLHWNGTAWTVSSG
jgi:hypothetical protein